MRWQAAAALAAAAFAAGDFAAAAIAASGESPILDPEAALAAIFRGKMWVWASIKPGISVPPPQSMISPFAGNAAFSASPSPAVRMRPSRTQRASPARRSSDRICA